MEFDLDQRTASLSVGEFAEFTLGPRGGGEGGTGLWRAQLGTYWHQQLRRHVAQEHPAAEFEVPISGQIAHRGWVLTLTGRVDQLVPAADGQCLREIKTVTCPLPAEEGSLRADYPTYFIQLATYAALQRQAAVATGQSPWQRPELLFVEAGSGLSQTVALSLGDERLFEAQLERLSEFLHLRQQARERRQQLRFRPAFATPRPGQESTATELGARLHQGASCIFFEAPTGFGKTGVLLEAALSTLQAGRFHRVIYLTGKATGQWQVVHTLRQMTALPTPARTEGEGLAIWQVRPKSEHCINATFHCLRDACRYLDGGEERWPSSGLARFYRFPQEPRDVATLREAGRQARICPYEITRAALAFNDVWIGDYNYVFAPANRGLFGQQPGFVAADTLLLIDEAHNLPSRVADAYSHAFAAPESVSVRDALLRVQPPARLLMCWEQWSAFLHQLKAGAILDLPTEDDARHLLEETSRLIKETPLDYAALGPLVAEHLWRLPALSDELAEHALPRLWWSARPGELTVTCLDAAAAIGPTLRSYGAVVAASATFGPLDALTRACGLDEPVEPSPAPPPSAPPARLGVLNKKDTRRLYRQLTRASDLLALAESREAAAPTALRANTPWRDHTYDVAYDARVDTRFQQRSRYYDLTAATVEALRAASRRSPPAAEPASASAPPIVAFFSSYAYAEAILQALATRGSNLAVALQPRQSEPATQASWMEQALSQADALFLVLGSSFAESIDVLGGRVNHALVVGPALPEVNPVQRARVEAWLPHGRDTAFRHVYQIPGLQKVNQALGRLVRAPGQSARVLLHCQRFTDPSYTALLAADYQRGVTLASQSDLQAWLERPAPVRRL